MAEEKKRGRPKKEIEEKPVQNEEKKTIKMAENKPKSEYVTIDAVQQRWATIFGKYANQGFDTLSQAWKTASYQLNNPFLQNQRIKHTNATPAKATQEQIAAALSSPESSEDILKSVSMWLYYTNYVYNILIKLNRDTPCYNYYYLPQYVDKADMKSELFKEESKKVDRILKAFQPNLTFKTVSTQVALEGKASYLPRTSFNKKQINFFLLQKLNPNQIKLTGFGSEQQFIASFNLAIFLQPSYSPSQYPKFIQDAWQQMIEEGIVKQDAKTNQLIINTKAKAHLPNSVLEWDGSSYLYWIQLPQDLCFTFYSDGSHPNSFPDTLGLFNDLSELDDYKWLQANLLSKGVNSVLTAEVPLVQQNRPRSQKCVRKIIHRIAGKS